MSSRSDWIQENKILVFILFLGGLILISYFIYSLSNTETDMQTCECFEVVGDEQNFWCNTPSGELDTKGECVGRRSYK